MTSLLLAIALSATTVSAQTSTPTGSCVSGTARINSTNGRRYICVSSAWTEAVNDSNVLVTSSSTGTTKTLAQWAAAIEQALGTITSQPLANTYYVAHGGSDAAAGTIGAPWQTLAYAVAQLAPGDTLYIRGAADTNGCATGGTSTACNAACASNTGACWTETEACSTGIGGTCSPLSWGGGKTTHAAGTSGSPITIAAYPGEYVIIEPSSGAHVATLDATRGKAECSYLNFKNLIFDARNASGSARDAIRVDGPSPMSSDPSTHCEYVNFTGGVIRHGSYTSGLQLTASRFTFTGVTFMENGAQATSGDHDHAIYVSGIANVFQGGRIYNNIQAISVWNECLKDNTTESYCNATVPADYHSFGNGANEFRDMEIDHNGVAVWHNGATVIGTYYRNGDTPDLNVCHPVGSYSVITGNSIHDNQKGSNGTAGGMSAATYAIGAMYCGEYPTGSNWTSNRLSPNALYNCGSYSITCTGNVAY